MCCEMFKFTRVFGQFKTNMIALASICYLFSQWEIFSDEIKCRIASLKKTVGQPIVFNFYSDHSTNASGNDYGSSNPE